MVGHVLFSGSILPSPNVLTPHADLRSQPLPHTIMRPYLHTHPHLRTRCLGPHLNHPLSSLRKGDV